MIIVDRELKQLVRGDSPLVYPVCENGIQPASVDIRLGNSFLKPVKTSEREYNSFDVPINYELRLGEYVLQPHEFVLGTTVEVIDLPLKISAFVEGRSSIGRMGLFIQNAGWIDPGFKGQITLELYNASEIPILLSPSTRVGQIVFCRNSIPCLNPYKGKYQYQTGATGSLINLDAENERN